MSGMYEERTVYVAAYVKNKIQRINEQALEETQISSTKKTVSGLLSEHLYEHEVFPLIFFLFTFFPPTNVNI